MMQDGPWNRYRQQTPPAAPAPQVDRIYGQPKQPDPVELQRLGMAQEDQARQNRMAPIQEEAARLGLEKTRRDLARTDTGKPLPEGAAKRLEDTIGLYANLKGAVGGFQDDYAGNTITGGLESDIQALSNRFGTPGQRDWWANFRTLDNQIRNELFGATLTPSEQAAYAQTSINESMDPRTIKENLGRREKVIREALARRTKYLKANGYNAEAIDALTGEFGADFVDQPAARARVRGEQRSRPGETSLDRGTFAFSDQIPEEVKGYRLAPEQEQEIAGAISVGDEGQALALLRKHTGYEPTEQTIGSVRKAIRNKGRLTFDYTPADEAYRAKLAAQNAQVDARRGPQSDLGVLGAQGGSFGFSDEIAGVSGGLATALSGGNAVTGYNESRDAQNLRVEGARSRAGVAGIATEVGAGAVIPVGALGAAGKGATLLNRMGQGARAGATGGALAGFGYGEGSGRITGAGAGALGGAAIGSVLPVAGQVISNRVGGLNRLLGRDPELPRRLVGEAIAADSNTPRSVGNALTAASGRGSPLSIADTGDNARQLLASVGRQPGPSRTLTREAVVQRQLAQQERIARAVVRDLGPTANVRETSDALIEQARAAAKPHYEAFEAAPGASSVKIDDLLSRPSVKKGLERAYRLAAEEGEDPTALGFTLNQAGEPELTRVPSFKTLDYIKQGMDDVVETYRDTTTGVLKLDGEGRKINNTLRTLINRVDAVNPAYKAARDAYAGPAKLDEALQKGAKALSRAPDDLSAEIARMSEPEREMYRLGLRKAITDFLESKTDGGDKVQALIGTPKKRAALARAFGDRAEFNRFMETLGDEAAMGQTYRAVAGNSSTAERQAFDQTTSDTGLAETAMDAALRGGKDGMWSATVAAIQKLRDVGRFGAGEAGQRAREGVAALLTESDPAVLRELVRTAQRAQALQRAKLRGGGNPRRAVASGVGEQIGRGVNALLPQPERTKK